MNFKYALRAEVEKALHEVKDQAFVKIDTDEWVWVTGYKGTDKDMKCKNDFQYELGKQYDMPEGEAVEACQSGFHMCMKLEDVYNYYPIECGRRYFECRALVRKTDLEKYGKTDASSFNSVYMFGLSGSAIVDKLAAKSIELIRELTIDEILAHKSEAGLWPEYVKDMAIRESFEEAKTEWHIIHMTEMGYARPLAEYICKNKNNRHLGGYDLAVALDSQLDISMDTKVNAIFSHI